MEKRTAVDGCRYPTIAKQIPCSIGIAPLGQAVAAVPALWKEDTHEHLD
jgi:hypothetical protein